MLFTPDDDKRTEALIEITRSNMEAAMIEAEWENFKELEDLMSEVPYIGT